MKNIIITILGIAVNIFVYLYSQATKRDLSMIVPEIYLFFILPLVLMVIVVAYTIYSYSKQKYKNLNLPKVLIVFFLLLIVLQFLLFSNDVLVKQYLPAISSPLLVFLIKRLSAVCLSTSVINKFKITLVYLGKQNVY